MEAFGLAGIPSEVWADSHAWFNYYLQDIDTPLIHDPNRVTISLKNEGAQNRDDVLTFADWPNSQVVQNKYYLGPRTETTNGTISVTPYSGKSSKNLILAGIESGAHSGVPVLSNTFEAYTEYTVKTLIDDIDRNNAVVYESTPLTADQTIVGIPRVSVWIVPQLKTVGMVAYLYDVDPATRVGVLLTNGPVSLHNTIPGQAIPVTFDMIMTSYRVPAGHTLALAIDTYDVLYAPATPLPYTLQFLYSAFQQPSLSLPILKP